MLVKRRNEVHSKKFSLIPVTKPAMFESWEFICFDCGNKDLNEFFQIDAHAHQDQLLATTYYFQPIEAIKEKIFYPVALVSLLNDKIEITKEERKGNKKEFHKELKNIPFPKRNYSSFPAVKIGRLGVLNQFRGKNIGTSLLNMVKYMFLNKNRTGCRYLTVDANKDALPFYYKNEFKPLWEKDQDSEQRVLYYDLKTFNIHHKHL